MAFKVGDVVRLKGGSPKMTVLAVDKEAKTIDTGWFDEYAYAGSENTYTTVYQGGLHDLQDVPFNAVVVVKE
jgi:uncharacterized protein YodC (DUF2158 family)